MSSNSKNNQVWSAGADGLIPKNFYKKFCPSFLNNLIQLNFADLQTGQNTEVEKFVQRNGALTADIAKLKSKNEKLETKYDKAKSDIKQLKSDLEREKDAKSRIVQESGKLKMELDKKQEDRNEIKFEKITDTDQIELIELRRQVKIQEYDISRLKVLIL